MADNPTGGETRKGAAPHSADCDSLDCPCYRAGQEDLLLALDVMKRLGMSTDDVLDPSHLSDGRSDG